MNGPSFPGMIDVSNSLIKQKKEARSMFIPRDRLTALQTPFSQTKLGQERASWFAFTRLAVIVPFTSSMTSNRLRSLPGRFG